MKTLFALLLLAIPAAQAADVTLTWTAPTANTDGSVPALIGGYNLYSASSEAALAAGTKLSVGNVLTYTYHNVAPGTYVYAVTTWYCVTAGNCAESAQSAHVSTTIGQKAVQPGLPGSVKVTVTVSAP